LTPAFTMFQLSSLPLISGRLLLLTDHLNAPAEFILNQILGASLRDDRRCVVVSHLQSFSHWNTVAIKLTRNVNLAQSLATDSLLFIDAAKDPLWSTTTVLSEDIFKPLYDRVEEYLKKGSPAKEDSPEALIIVDDVSVFEWMGSSIEDIKLFLRALMALSRKHNASLVVRHHLVTDDGIDDLLCELMQLCVYHVEVRPLSSGRSGAVSGQIAVHRGPWAEFESVDKSFPRSRATQYRLSDTGAVYFERGTGASVL